MLITLPYLQLAAGHAGCYGLQGRFISKNSLFSYSDDISSRYPGMLKDIPSCIWLLTDLRSKIHQYVPCGIPCNAHLETCGFSPASAGVENATAGSEASRSTEGALRIFPSFSWNGKCDSRERSESEHRRCVATFAGAHSSACGCAVQPAMQIALRLFGQDGVFPQLQLERKMRQQGAKRVGAPKVRYPSEFTS